MQVIHYLELFFFLEFEALAVVMAIFPNNVLPRPETLYTKNAIYSKIVNLMELVMIILTISIFSSDNYPKNN